MATNTRRRTYNKEEEDWIDMKGRYCVSFSDEYNTDSFPSYGYGYMEANVYDIETGTRYGSWVDSKIPYEYYYIYNQVLEYFYEISVTRDYINNIVYISSSCNEENSKIKFQDNKFSLTSYDGCSFKGKTFNLTENGLISEGVTVPLNYGLNYSGFFKVLGNEVYVYGNNDGHMVIDLESMTVISTSNDYRPSFHAGGPTEFYV